MVLKYIFVTFLQSVTIPATEMRTMYIIITYLFSFIQLNVRRYRFANQ